MTAQLRARGRHRKPSTTIATAQNVAVAALPVTLALTSTGPLQAITDSGPMDAISPAITSAAQPVYQADILHAFHHFHHFHQIKPGESLSIIALHKYGSATYWPALWWANRHRIHNPNVITAYHWLRTPHLRNLHMTHWVITRANELAAPPDPPARRHRHHHHHHHNQGGGVNFGGGEVLSFSDLERLWVSAGGPAWAESAAASVAECESGGRIHAFNPSGASGLWQILGQVVAGNVFDPFTNALNAVSKFKASGDTWAQWVCQP